MLRSVSTFIAVMLMGHRGRMAIALDYGAKGQLFETRSFPFFRSTDEYDAALVTRKRFNYKSRLSPPCEDVALEEGKSCEK